MSIATGTLDREFVEHVTGPVPAVPALAPAPGAPGPGDNSRLALRGYSTEDVMRVTTALAPPLLSHPVRGGPWGSQRGTDLGGTVR